MATDTTDSRTLIMDAAHELILQHGFAGTSIDAILERVGLTKGAFFHHFRSKSDLAHALIERFAEADEALLEGLLKRAERLSRDPLQQVLILVGLLEEMADELTEPYPGCLFASFCYETQLFDDEVHEVIREAFALWRKRLGEKLRQVLEVRTARLPADPDALADMLTVVVEGVYVLSKSMKDPKLVATQLRQYRNYLELLFGEG
jgi:TetR/AcrR family transcriptional repressor of nem operon